ncbi:hypothetical protein [Spiroplasma endosymbiont of Nebria brevicollis]|uniref:hypothetical protein n=1 Tax=Spiroplasma endosymbiont of Nebria brevicollis TaxID=3066284 RepID=UPI00313B6147
MAIKILETKIDKNINKSIIVCKANNFSVQILVLLTGFDTKINNVPSSISSRNTCVAS